MSVSDINVVVLIGRLTRDMELSYLHSGTALGKMSIAVNRNVKKDGGYKEVAHFFDLSLWGKPAEGLKQYLIKGTKICIHGELNQDRWEKDGKAMSRVTITVREIELLGGGKSAGKDVVSGQVPPADDFEDEIPY